MSLMKEIVPSCAWVMQQAGHVRIHEEKIQAYAEFILGRYSLLTSMDSQNHLVSDDQELTAAYFLALDSINFGSGYFHVAKECDVDLEYMVIARGLKKAFEDGTLCHPSQWLAAMPAQVSQMLSVPQGRHPKLDELLELFTRHLRGTGEKILSGYQGRVMTLLEQADFSASRLVDIVSTWDGFHDVHAYKGREVPILKRAQILAADLNLALQKKFKDMDRLTVFADNMVPHVLRCDGVLEYGADLAARIDGGVPVVSGSEEEIEIRAAAIYAVELMKQAAQAQGRMVTSVNIDHLLWHRGYEPELYSKRTHRALMTDY